MMMRLPSPPWLYAGAFALGVAVATPAGMSIQSLREAASRAELATELAKCRQGQAVAAVESMDRTARTIDENITRLAGVADRITATGERLAQLEDRPRENPDRIECLADDDDAERMRILSGPRG
jgi:hypothetical protein